MINMRHIVGSIVKDQASVGNWLIYASIVDTLRFYIYCFGEGGDGVFRVELYQMLEYQDGFIEAR